MRKDYQKYTLKREELQEDPFAQFDLWLKEALPIEIEANAMQLATATKEGRPSCRTVLLKEFTSQGLVFFTNYESRKGQELKENPRAFVLFLWKKLERQVSIEGSIEKISREESERYFQTRPRGAQLGTIASKQGSVVSSREFLDAEYQKAEKEFDGKLPSLPSYWGGYRLIPERFEFWQGRTNRLHDRFQYRQEGDHWVIERLSP